MRIAHTMLRVSDLSRSLRFYEDALKMTTLTRMEFPTERFTLVYLGYARSEGPTPQLELTHNWDISSYSLGNAFGHIAIEVADLDRSCSLARSRGAKVVREPGPMASIASNGAQLGRIAFIEDPDGYRVELIEAESKG